MSETNIKTNGSWLGDASDEFKKLPTWGKFAAAGVLVLVAVIAYYEYSKGKSVSSAVGAAQVASGQDLSTGGGMQSPFSQIPSGSSSVPLLPPGVTGIFDGAGTLIGWQGGNPPQGGTPTPTPTPTPIGGGNPPRGGILTPIPALQKGWKIWQGGGGRWWTGTGPKNETLLNSLFPSGTKFDYTNNTLYATAPGDVQSKVGTVVTMPKSPPPVVHRAAMTTPPPAPKVVGR